MRWRRAAWRCQTLDSDTVAPTLGLVQVSDHLEDGATVSDPEGLNTFFGPCLRATVVASRPLTSQEQGGNGMPNKLRVHVLGTALLLGLTAAPTAAQTGGMPADIASKLAELGPVINPPETAKLYASLHEKEPYQGVKVTRDIKFGPDEQRQALDVFVADSVTAVPRPVLMFVHGGGFLRGGRRTPGTPFYDNVMLVAARNQMVGVHTHYRLAPQ